jgi:hypothetical protein
LEESRKKQWLKKDSMVINIFGSFLLKNVCSICATKCFLENDVKKFSSPGRSSSWPLGENVTCDSKILR